MRHFIFLAVLCSLNLSYGEVLVADTNSNQHYGLVYDHRNKPNPREIVFIHGMFMNADSWQRWLEKFNETGYKVSAPAWPCHEKSVREIRDPANFVCLSNLTLDDVIHHYRILLKNKKQKPILIGHSMGGLVAQVLLSEGLASAAIVLDSAPPKWVFTLSWSFLMSNKKSFYPSSSPVQLSFEEFTYAFTNAQTPEVQHRIYNEFYVPESRRVGRGPLGAVGNVDDTKARGPLLIVAGEMDHIIPAKLNYQNFKKYKKTPAYTEFQLLAGKDHSLALSPGWEKLATYVQSWIERRFKD